MILLGNWRLLIPVQKCATKRRLCCGSLSATHKTHPYRPTVKTNTIITTARCFSFPLCPIPALLLLLLPQSTTITTSTQLDYLQTQQLSTTATITTSVQRYYDHHFCPILLLPLPLSSNTITTLPHHLLFSCFHYSLSTVLPTQYSTVTFTTNHSSH